MAKLIVKVGTKVLGEYRLQEDSTVIGSEKGSNILLADENISPRHAQIKRENNNYFIVDLGSKSGLRVNGQPITKIGLKNNDLIDIGNARLVFVEEEEPKGIFPGKELPRHDKKLSHLLISSIIVALVIGTALFFLFRSPNFVRKTIDEGSREKGASLYYDKGTTYYQIGRYYEAITEFKKVLELKPDYLDTEEYLRRTEEKLDYEVKDIFKKAERLSKSNYFSFLNEAKEELQKVKKLVPDPRDFRYLEALSTIEAIEEKIGELTREFYDKGIKYFNEEEYGKALVNFKKVSEIDPDYREVNTYIENTESEIRAKEERITDLFKKGIEHFEEGKYEEAVSVMEKFLTTNPEHSEAAIYISKAKSLLGKRREKLAKDYYEKGVKYYREGKYLESLTMLEQALTIEPDYGEAKKYLKEIRRKLDKSETSKKPESKTDSLRLEKAKKYYQMGLVYEGMGDIERAVKEWKKVLKIISDSRQDYYKKAKQKLRFYEK